MKNNSIGFTGMSLFACFFISRLQGDESKNFVRVMF